jgi:hypothetical protein
MGMTMPRRHSGRPFGRVRSIMVALVAVLAATGVLHPQPAWAADEEESATELAKKTQNPVADLISVPFQNNFNFDTGSKEATVYILNVQPVIPINLTKEWNLITRTIIPIINQPSLFPGPDKISGSAVGLGDINPSLFLSPAKPGHFIWGLGPTFTLPTATDVKLGSREFSMGPTGVALMTEGPWVFGVLASQQWSVVGWGDKSVSQMLIQPFVNYNLGDGWYITSSPIITADWKNESGHEWTVPVGAGVGKLFRAGKLPINTSLQGYYNAETPSKFSSGWQLRFQVQFLLPKF